MVALAAAAAVLAPVATSPAAAQSSGSGDGVVVIANGWSPADVGAAAPLADRLGAAVLYASKGALGQPTVDALEELAPSRVLLMGGPAALTSAVESQVRRTLAGVAVERFSGTDRIDTAAKAALSAPTAPAGRTVVIASGWSPPDVGAAAPLAASLGGSVLFANKNSLGAPTVTALRRLAPSQIIVVGGTAALSTRIEAELGKVVPGVQTRRLAGTDRTDTAARGTAESGAGLGAPVVLADGWSPADVGIAAPLAATLGGSVLVTERSKLGERTAIALSSLSPSRIILIGGSERLARAVDADLERRHAGVPRVNVAGADRIATAALAALLGVQASAQQERFEDAVATVAPGDADCDAAPRLDVRGIRVVDPPANLNDPTATLTVAEVVRIAGGCVLVDYVALAGRTVAEVRRLLADEPSVFAVGEPPRGFEPLHSTSPHTDYGIGTGGHHDDGSTEQWALHESYMKQLWDGWDPDNPVTVAVIDTGVDTRHPDLENRIASSPLDDDCHNTDTEGHGTHVAGIIAAESNGQYITGVAPKARVLPVGGVVKGTTCEGGPALAMIDILNRPEASRPKVINMSFGRNFVGRPPTEYLGFHPAYRQEYKASCRGLDGQYERVTDLASRVDDLEEIVGDLSTQIDNNCDPFRQMLEIAEKLKVVAVAAAGNCFEKCDAWHVPDNSDGTLTWREDVENAFSFPAVYSNVIAVAAVDQRGDRAAYSSVHDYVEIAAPGGNHDPGILSTVPLAACDTETLEADGETHTYWSPNGCGTDDEPKECQDSSSPDPNVFNEPSACAHYVGYASGTSMASPFVAGVVAHMLNRHPDASPEQVRQALRQTARDRGDAGKDDEYGHGIVQPLAAIERLGKILEDAKPRLESLRAWSTSCAPDECQRERGTELTLVNVSNSEDTAFDPKDPAYTATVPKGTQIVTVEGIAEKGFELSSISPPDADPSTPGHQVRLSDAVSVPQSKRADKPGTSAAVGERFLEVVGADWSGAVIVASAENFPDGLAAASLAGSLRAPILLTPKNRLDPAIAKFVSDNNVSEVVIMGGPAAVTAPVERSLQGIVGTSAVSRIWGADRYQTALRIAERVAAEAGQTTLLCGTDQRAVFIATGRNSADALAASPAAYAAKTPVLLVDPRASSLHPDVRAFIRDQRIDTAVILGGTKAVPQRLQEQLDALSTVNRVTRVAGANRYATAAEFAHDITSDCYDDVEAVTIANGQGFTDALAAGPLTAELNGVLLLTGPNDVPPDTLDAMTQLGREAQLTNITLALLAIGDIAQDENAITDSVDSDRRLVHEEAAKSISSREMHTCAITEGGYIRCWGRNLYGEANPPEGRFAALKVGEFHSCALEFDQTVICWGRDWHGQIDPPAGKFAVIDPHWQHSCGIRPDGGVECWGAGRQSDPPSGQFTHVATSLSHSCGITFDRTIACWGSNGEVQRNVPSGTFKDIEAGDRNFCGIRTDGTVTCWGENARGQNNAPPGTFLAVAPAWNTCGIRTNGTISCWGNRLGRQTPPAGTFVAITTGAEHACAVRTDGSVECWGINNRHGQLDIPDDAQRIETTSSRREYLRTFSERAERITITTTEPVTTSKPANDSINVEIQLDVTDPQNPISTKTYFLTIHTE